MKCKIRPIRKVKRMDSGFKERLARRRKDLGLTQSALAERLGVNQRTVSAYESIGRSPDVETLARLAGLLDCSTDWLMGLEGAAAPELPGWFKPLAEDVTSIRDERDQEAVGLFVKTVARKGRKDGA